MKNPSNDKKPAISCGGNGPLIVKGLTSLKNAAGEALESKPTLALCRCGGSANKPFCDGAHAKNGFSGENNADRSPDKLEAYPGKEITILDNRFQCAHVGTCTEQLKQVFRYGEAPWIEPGQEDTRLIQAAIDQCPSGALSYQLSNLPAGEGPGEAAGEASITVSKNGPYYVRGGIDLETTAWAEGATRQRYALCRCGASKNKPFCDGSHYEARFKD